MILMTARLIRIFIPLALAAGIYFFLRRRFAARVWIGHILLILIFSLCAYGASKLTPPVCDEVTITALDERNEASLAAEIRLRGYGVDGEERLCADELRIREGKWFWLGENYCWRPETDPRQPEGTTSAITIGVPAGWERTLYFSGDGYGGIAEISLGGGNKAC